MSKFKYGAIVRVVDEDSFYNDLEGRVIAPSPHSPHAPAFTVRLSPASNGRNGHDHNVDLYATSLREIEGFTPAGWAKKFIKFVEKDSPLPAAQETVYEHKTVAVEVVQESKDIKSAHLRGLAYGELPIVRKNNARDAAEKVYDAILDLSRSADKLKSGTSANLIDALLVILNKEASGNTFDESRLTEITNAIETLRRLCKN